MLIAAIAAGGLAGSPRDLIFLGCGLICAALGILMAHGSAAAATKRRIVDVAWPPRGIDRASIVGVRVEEVEAENWALVHVRSSKGAERRLFKVVPPPFSDYERALKDARALASFIEEHAVEPTGGDPSHYPSD